MPGRRIALLVGTNRYQDRVFSQLTSPEADVIALADALKDPRIGAFNVQTMINRTTHAVKMRIEQLFTSAGAMDMLLLYFSGHGVKDAPGRLHLVATDTQSRMLSSTAIGANFLRDQIDDSAARKVAIWLDCCYSGAFPPGLTPKSDQRVDVVDQLTDRSGRGCVVMTASTHIQQAFEGHVVRHLETHPSPSIFTRTIVRGLKTGEADLNQDGDIDSSELYEYVYNQVKSITPNQTPTRSDQLVGSMLIASNPLVMQLDPAIPAEIRQNLRSKIRGFRLSAVDALTDLAIVGDPIATGALEQLVHCPDAVVSQAAQQALQDIDQRAEGETSGILKPSTDGSLFLFTSPDVGPRKTSPRSTNRKPPQRLSGFASSFITPLLLVSAGIVFGGSVWLGFYFLWKWHTLTATALSLLTVLTATLIAPKICRAKDFWTRLQLAFVSLFVATSPLVTTWIAAM